MIKMQPKRKPASNKKPASTPTKKKQNKSKQPAPKYIESLCAIADPFCSAANLGKYLDRSNIKSLPWAVHSRFTLTSNGSGAQGIIFCANYNYEPQSVSTAITFPNVFNFSGAFAASANPASTAVRMVSSGVIIRNVCAPLTASGMVRIRGFSPKLMTTIAADVSSNTYNCDYFLDIPLQDCKQVAVVIPPTSDESKDWVAPGAINPNALVAAAIPPSWGTLLIAVDGVPNSTVVLDIEYFQHWEIQLADDNNLMQLATPAPPYTPKLADAISFVTSAAAQIYMGGPTTVSKAVATLASNYARSKLQM